MGADDLSSPGALKPKSSSSSSSSNHVCPSIQVTADLRLFPLQVDDDLVTPKVLGVLHFVGKYRPLAAEFPDLMDSLVPVCQQLATAGSPKQAKHAIRCLFVNVTDNQEGVFTEILEVSLRRTAHGRCCGVWLLGDAEGGRGAGFGGLGN